VPSVLTMSSEKRKKSNMHDGFMEKIGSVVDTLARSNAIQDRVNDLNDKRFRSEQRKENREERKEIRDGRLNPWRTNSTKLNTKESGGVYRLE
jgi:hypothetical protein